MINIDFISLPKEVEVPADWGETPDLETKVDHLAQSYFSDWHDVALDRLDVALMISGVSLLVGIGVSIYFVSIPSIFLCGVGFVICLIGTDAVCREQTIRCQNVCLQLEHWCQQFKEVGERLKEKVEPFVVNDWALNPRDVEEIVELMDALPRHDLGEGVEKPLEEWIEKLKVFHSALFGEKRSIGQGTWSDHWIRHCDSTFCSQVPFLYIWTSGFKKCAQEEDSAKRNEGLKARLKAMYELHLDQSSRASDQDSRDKDGSRKVKMWFLSGRFDAPQQGQESFATMMEEAEYWRQNIAIFRSSLTRGPNKITLLGNIEGD